MAATLEHFNRKAWINRFGKALEDTAARARPHGVPLPLYGSMPEGSYRREVQRRYREMAELSKSDPYAAKLFHESFLWLDVVPDGVLDLLLEHPVFEHAWSRGSRKAFHSVRLLGGGHADVKSLIRNLAKLSVKFGGERAATMLHRFLVAGEGVRLHAHEIMVIHGLKLDEPIPLGPGAYLASYDAVRERFGLPEDPEPWLRRRGEGLDLHPGRLAHPSSGTVLVRQVNWGPAVAPCDCPTSEHPLKLRCRFPDDHRLVSVADIFGERETLLHLLSIAMRSKLVSHTVINAVPPWMGQLDPNLRTGSPGGARGVFDVWPEDRAPSMPDVDAFRAAARGWRTYCAGKGDRSTELAIRRTAASFGIAGGRFGVEDRLLDASIALEAMYGPFGSGEGITQKISSRAAWLLGESGAQSCAISRDMRSFYKTRSKVIHGTAGKDLEKRRRELASTLASGRELARRTLLCLLARGPVNDESEWDALVL